MENSENKVSCSCGGDGSNNSDCCGPKPKNKITKIIFIVIIAAALGIIGYKLLNKPTTPACDPTTCTTADTTKKCCEK